MSDASPLRLRVLVVEDDDDIRASVEQCLEDGEFEVFGVANGEAALAWLEENSPPPALIVLDLMMPVMDGFTFRRAQIADVRFASIPVLLLTADGEGAEKALSKELGLALIRKPCEPDALVRAARRACDAAHERMAHGD